MAPLPVVALFTETTTSRCKEREEIKWNMWFEQNVSFPESLLADGKTAYKSLDNYDSPIAIY